MNAKKSLFSYMKKNKVVFEDIEYIIVDIDEEDDYPVRMEISKDDFISTIDDLEVEDLTLGIKLVGKNFYITSDIDDAHVDEGYWGIVRIPSRPKKIINVAKMALLSDGGCISELVGIKFADDLDN